MIFRIDKLLLNGLAIASVSLAFDISLNFSSTKVNVADAQTASDPLNEHFDPKGNLPSRSTLEFQQLPSLIDNQMQLESVVPSDRVFAPAHQPFEHSMRLGTTGITDFNRSGIGEANASDFSPASVQKAAQHHHAPRHQLHKSGVADQIREGCTPVGQHLQGVEILEGPTA